MISGVKFHNLFSYEDAAIDFDKGVTLIEGWNHDDGTPEGSGKSAIPNVITWVCFGKIPKDAKIDEVIREGEDSGYGVVTLRNGAEVVRSRKPNDLYFRREPNGAEIRGKDAKETQAWIEELLGMGFDTFCQAVYFPQNYAKKFITSSETEKAAIISEIQDLNDFTEARKLAAKLLTTEEAAFEALERDVVLSKTQVANLEAALGENQALLDEFQRDKAQRLHSLDRDIEATEKALAHLLENKVGSLQELESEREQIKGEIESTQAAFSELKDVLRNAEAKVKDRARAEREHERATSELSRLTTKLKAIKTERKSLELETLRTKETDIQKDLSALEEHRSQQKVALLSVRRNDETRARIQNGLQVIERKERETAKQIEAFQMTEAKTCPTCGNAMDAEHAREHLEALKAELEANRARRLEIAKDLAEIPQDSPAELEAALTQTERALREMKSELTSISDVMGRARLLDLESKSLTERIQTAEASIEEWASQLTEAAPDLTQIQQDVEEISNLLGSLKKVQTDVQSAYEQLWVAEQQEKNHRTQLERLARARAEDAARSGASIERLIKSTQTQLQTAQEQMVAKDARRKEALSKIARLTTLKQGFTEVKQYVFKGLLKELTKKANKYLGELFEVPISIKFSNEGEDGEVSKINVEVTIDGVPRALGLYSGGQARRIQIAVDLALSEIISSRSQKAMDLRILDEPFKDLSEISMEKAVRLFETLKGSTVLIEHNSIAKSIVNNVIRVELKDKVSRRVQ